MQIDPPTTPKGRPQRVTVLGATGSIGSSTLDVVARHPERYEIFALSARQRLDELADSLKLRPEYPDVMHEVARARALDQFALAHDAQLSF